MTLIPIFFDKANIEVEMNRFTLPTDIECDKLCQGKPYIVGDSSSVKVYFRSATDILDKINLTSDSIENLLAKIHFLNASIAEDSKKIHNRYGVTGFVGKFS